MNTPVLSAQLLSALIIATTAGLITVRKDDLDPARVLQQIKTALNTTEIDAARRQVILQIVAEAEGGPAGHNNSARPLFEPGSHNRPDGRAAVA